MSYPTGHRWPASVETQHKAKQGYFFKNKQEFVNCKGYYVTLAIPCQKEGGGVSVAFLLPKMRLLRLPTFAEPCHIDVSLLLYSFI